MARIRTIKPEFFKHEHLSELSPLHRLLFVGLWTVADRFGRLEDRPKRLKVELLPYDKCNVDTMLRDLQVAGFIVRYEAHGGRYVAIPSFLEHQRISGTEKDAPETIPAPPDDAPRVPHGSTVEALGNDEGSASDHRKGKEERKGVEEGKGHTESARVLTPSTSLAWGPSPTQKRKTHCVHESAIGLDVPEFLHRELAAKLANAGVSDPNGALATWYHETERAYNGVDVGEDAPDFWRARFREWRGTSPSSKPARGVVDIDAEVEAMKAILAKEGRIA